MKRRYHSDFILQYKLGLLPQHIIDQIPVTTRHYWKNGAYDNYFAPEVLYAQEENMQLIKTLLMRKELLVAAKGFYHVFMTLQQITASNKTMQNHIRRHRKQVVQSIETHKNTLGFERLLKVYGISKHQFYAWRSEKRCAISLFQKCYKRYPNQLSVKAVTTIKTYLTNPEYKGWSIISIYYQMLRDQRAYMSTATFYRYAHKLNLTKPRIKKPKYPTGIRINTPGTLLHIDVTIFKLPDHTKVYLYVLIDNTSRYILNMTASLKYSPEVSVKNLRQGLSKYQHPYNTLLCDGGIENKGAVDDQLQEYNIQKLIAQKDISFSNSMVEAVNKRIKYDFLYWQYFPNFSSLERYLPKLIAQYNEKPHSALFGFTPKEVFNGCIPSRQNFSALIAHHKTKRVAKNTEASCVSCETNTL